MSFHQKIGKKTIYRKFRNLTDRWFDPKIFSINCHLTEKLFILPKSNLAEKVYWKIIWSKKLPFIKTSFRSNELTANWHLTDYLSPRKLVVAFARWPVERQFFLLKVWRYVCLQPFPCRLFFKKEKFAWPPNFLRRII
jgi:hypothetical protein